MIDATIADGRPTNAVFATNILQSASTDPEGVVPWLATLSRSQLDAVWVAVVVEHHQAGTLSITTLATVLAHVRDRFRADPPPAQPRQFAPAPRKGVMRPSAIENIRRSQIERRARERAAKAPATAVGNPHAVLTGENDGG